MPTTILWKGEVSEKRISCTAENFMPFLGLDGVEGLMIPGIGLYNPETYAISFWRHKVGYFPVIRAWRAVQFLEHINFVISAIFYDSWEAAGRDSESIDEIARGRVKSQMGKDYEPFRDYIMNAMLPTEDLAQLIYIIQKNGVKIDKKEINKERELGLLDYEFAQKICSVK
jgi:hypothetical protein